MHFVIESETNNIIGYDTAAEAQLVAGAEHFASEAELSELAAGWPAARLIEVWNSLPGVTPVKKFKDRATGISRIWKAIQQTEDAVAESVPETRSEVIENVEPEPEVVAEAAPTAPTVSAQAPDVASEEAPATTKTTRAKKEPKAAKAPREASKTETVLALMRREGGVGLKEIMAVTNWQAHSVRGFISGTLGKRMGIAVVSTKGANGERSYSIKK